jgi:hypothetical protein
MKYNTTKFDGAVKDIHFNVTNLYTYGEFYLTNLC